MSQEVPSAELRRMVLDGRYTVVTTSGRVLLQANNGTGLGVVVVGECTHQPYLSISEVSDDETVNLYLEMADSFVVERGEDVGAGDVSTHQVLGKPIDYDLPGVLAPVESYGD